jgi:hypothetical protein
MERTSDVMATWAWGLRRYAWVVVLCVVGLGVLVPVAQSRSDDVYRAQAQVGPTQKLLLPNLDPLPRFAQSVFDNGAVARDVRTVLDLPADASVVPGKVSLQTAQDNPVMVVNGTGSTPRQAAAVANKAAATFVTELNQYSGSVGTFGRQSDAVPPAQAEPKLVSGPLGVAVGVLAGLVAGCGLVGLIVALRRPVVGAAAAEGATGLPVVGQVALARRGPPDEKARVAVGSLSRRLLREKHDVVYVAGPVRSQVDQVAAGVEAFLTHAGATPGASVPEVSTLSTSSLETWVAAPDRCSLTLLVVPEGIRSATLRQLADQHSSGGATAVVLVSRRWALTSRKPVRRAAARMSHAG